ncbi:oligosaccharide repeat unit polymerase [Bacillus cereus]|nr:oligosaccharide repeat unit polymerase [Bacillus cereus]
MVTLLFVSTLMFFVLIGRIKTGNLYSPLTFYLVFWCFWVIISLINPYQLYEVSQSTYTLVWSNIIFFSFGFLLVSKRVKVPALEKIKLPGNKFIKTKKFLMIQLTVLVILIYYYIKYNLLLSGLDSSYMRTALFEQGYLFSSSLENILYFWFIGSFVYLSIALFISNIVMGGKKNITFFISLVCCYLYGEIGNGRFIYFYIIILFLVSIALKHFINKKLKFNIKKKKKKNWVFYFLIIFGTVFTMNRTSAERMGVSLSLSDSVSVFFETSFPQFVLYFTGPFRALDSFLTSGITNETGYTFGRAFLGGIEELFSVFIIAIAGGYPVRTANTITSSFTVPPISVGPHDTFNAFYTSVMNSYIDGGVAFVIMFAFIYGIASGLIYNYCLRNLNIFTFALLIYTTYQMVVSEFRWNYQAPETWIIIIILAICNYIYKRKLELLTKSNITTVQKNTALIAKEGAHNAVSPVKYSI